jgi:hypothetical protein
MRAISRVLLVAAAVSLAAASRATASDAGVANVFVTWQPQLQASVLAVLRDDAAYVKHPLSVKRQSKAIATLRASRVVIVGFDNAVLGEPADSPGVATARTELLTGLNDLRVAFGRLERGLRAIDARRPPTTIAGYQRRLALARRDVKRAEGRGQAAIEELLKAQQTLLSVPGGNANAPPASVLPAADVPFRDAVLGAEDRLTKPVAALHDARLAQSKDPYSVARARRVVRTLGALKAPVANYAKLLAAASVTSPVGVAAHTALQKGIDAAARGYALLQRANERYIAAAVPYARSKTASTLKALLGAVKRFRRDSTSAEGVLRDAERLGDRGLQLLGLVRRAPR